MLWKTNEILILLALIALFWLANEAGFRLGFRLHDKTDETHKSHLGALQSAILGLLALLLGFSFAMAVTRYDARKSLVLTEVNAIGTTYLRAGFRPDARRSTNHVPEPVLLLLFAMCCGALGFVGCGSGLAGRRRLPSTIMFIVLSAMVLIIIMDIDRPTRGLITVSQDTMLRLQASLAGDAP